MLRTRKRRLLALAAILALVAAAAAIAAWLVNSTGPGRTQVASLTSPSVSLPGSWSGIANLFPGGQGDVQVNVTNTNPVPLTIVSWQQSSSQPSPTYTPTNNSTCPASNFSPVAGPAATVPTTIAANASNVLVTLKNAVALSASAPTACQGQDVTITGSPSPFQLNFSSP
jgi:hypothetical protein